MWRLVFLLAGCGRIGFGLGGDSPPTDGTPTDGIPTDGTPTDGMSDSMMSTTGLGDTSTGADNSAGVTIVSAGRPHAPGSLLVAAVHWSGITSAVITVSDSAGNIYTPLTRGNAPGGSGSLQLFFVNTSLGNTNNVVTATFSGLANKRRILVHEYPGVVAQTGQGTSFGTNAMSGMTGFVGAGANSLVISSCFTPSSAVTFSPGANFALGAVAGNDSQLEDRLVPVAGTANGSMSWTPSSDYVIALVVFDR